MVRRPQVNSPQNDLKVSKDIENRTGGGPENNFQDPRPCDSESPKVSETQQIAFAEIGKVVEKDTPGEAISTAAQGLVDTGISFPPAPVSIFLFGWQRTDLRRFVGLSLAAIVTLVFLWFVQSILPPFLISFFLAALFEPTLREFEKHKRTRVRGILTLYMAGVCLIGVVAFIVVPRVLNQATEISQNLNVYVYDMQTAADSFMKDHAAALNKIGIRQTNISALIKDKSGTATGGLTTALAGIAGTMAGVASKALWLVIIPLCTFFFMRDYPVLRARIITQFPNKYHERIDIMSREVMDVFSAYLRGLAKICSLYSVVAIALYSVLGLRYSLILGIFAGLFYAVPYVGQLFTAVGTGVIAYLMEDHTIFFFFHLRLPPHSIAYTLTVVIAAVVAQNIFDQILYPRIVGGSVGLHPVASIFSLMAGATLFGIWGMLFAVPVAASIQIIIMYLFPKIRMAPAEALLNTEQPAV